MVQTQELPRTKKKQTYLISPTSREKGRLSETTFFTDKEKLSFQESEHIYTQIRLNTDGTN